MTEDTDRKFIYGTATAEGLHELVVAWLYHAMESGFQEKADFIKYLAERADRHGAPDGIGGVLVDAMFDAVWGDSSQLLFRTFAMREIVPNVDWNKASGEAWSELEAKRENWAVKRAAR